MSSDRYPFREIEAKWQATWEARKQFRVTEDPGRPKFYCLEMFPVPLGPHPHGPRAGLRHRRSAGPLQVDARLQRAAPDGLGRLRPARRERRHRARRASGHLDLREHRQHAGPAPEDGHLLRLGPRGHHLRSRVLQVGAAHLHPDARARPRLSPPLDRELVPVVPDRARQRAGRGRPLLALRLRGHQARDRRLVLQDHRLRRGAARVVRSLAGLARARDDDAAQLDRQERGRGVRSAGGRASRSEDPRVHHAARHRVRHDLRGAGARASAGRCADRRRGRARGGRALPRRGGQRVGGRAPRRGSAQARPPPAGAGRQPVQPAPRSRSSSPTTC